MRQIIVVVILMVLGLAGLFAWFAYALRLDVQARFRRIQDQLAADAMEVMRDVFRRIP